jgi:TolB-like protein/class 3 adenylate cyclase/Tfp pilus assembly protein PilF
MEMERRLAAILAADVVEYSRLMGEDEAGTLAALKRHRTELIDPKVAEHHGRIVKLMGDGALVEFASVVDAVECAVGIQRAMAERNADTLEEKRITFRIGINLGDVIVEGDDIYGGGVNVADRLEKLAEPGGVCISGKVYEEVGGKLQLGFEDLGDRRVKNIAEPVRVYRVLLEPGMAGKVIEAARPRMARHWRLVAAVAILVIAFFGGLAWWRLWAPDLEPASTEKMAFPLPEKPSIAVLPFYNLSGDPGQDHFTDGTTENIITLLSKVPGLFVIARNSTFAYKDKPVKVQQVAEDLGVQYVLEGSVQRSGDQVRITAQLVDALEGHQLWAERYDREITDVFAIQDEIALNVISALHVVLREGEQARVLGSGTRSVEAWEIHLQAQVEQQRYTKEGNTKARKLWQQALVLDQEYALAWVMIGWTHWIDVRFGFSDSREDSLRAADEAVERALAVDDTDPDSYGLLGNLHLIKGEHEKAIAMSRKALALNPNNSGNAAQLAMTMFFSGRPEQALELIRRAMRLDPNYPLWFLMPMEEAYRLTGRYDEGIETIEEVLRRLDHFFTRTRLALYYAQSGRDEEARAEIARVLRASPDMNLQYWANAQFFKAPAQLERDLADLRRVGLPE